MCKKILITFCCLFSFWGILQAQDYIDLQYHFKAGDQIQIHQKASEESYLTVKGIPQRTSNQRDAVLLLTVKKILPGDIAEIEASFKKIVLHSNQKNLTVSINTNSAEKDVFNRLFKGLVDKKFTLKMEPNGTIDEVTGMDTIISQVVEALPEVKGRDKSKIKEFLLNQMGGEQIKTSLSMVLPYYPAYKVRQGDSWSSHLSAGGFYDGQIDNYWKMTFGTKYLVKLENTGKFDTNPSKVVSLGSGQKGRMNLNGDVNGKYVINAKTALPLRSVIHSELNGDFTFFEMKRGKKKGEFKVPVRVVRNASYEIKHL